MGHIILYGFTSVGKTFFGKQLSEIYLLPFIDLDHIIEALFFKQYKYPLSFREIYQKKGSSFFRNLERKACFTLKQSPFSIVSLGGGSLLRNFEFLTHQGRGIYLKCSFNFIYKRLLEKGIPDIFKNLDKKSLKEVFNKRCLVYEAFPNKHIIDVDKVTTTQQILKQLEKLLWEIIPLEQH